MKTAPVATPELIDELLAQHRGNYANFGLRVDPADYEQGAILPPSRVWNEGEATEETMPGTSAIDIADGRRVLEHIRPYLLNKDAFGDTPNIYLLGSHSADAGEDTDAHGRLIELVMHKPVVIHRFSVPMASFVRRRDRAKGLSPRLRKG